MLKKSIKVLFFLTLSLNTLAQNIRIDSLLHLFDTDLDDTTNVNILNKLSWEYYRSDLEKSFHYATEALNESKRIAYQKGEARAHNLQGIIFSMKGKENLAIEANLKCLEIARQIKNSVLIGNATNDLGISYDKINAPEKALLYYHEALEISNKANDIQGICFALSNIGILHLKENNLEESSDYFNRSIELGLKTKDSLVLSMAYTNLGYTALEQKSYSEARSFFDKSKQIAERIGDKLTFLDMLIAAGDVEIEEGNYEIAEIKYLEAMSNIEDYGINDESKLYTYSALAEVYTKQQRYNEAIDVAELGYDWAQKNEDLSYQLIFSEQLYENYEGIKQIDRALEFHKKFKTLTDSLYDVEKAEKVLALESKYQLEQRTLENQMLKEVHLKDEAQLRQKNLVNLFALFALLSVGLFTSLLFRNYKKKKIYSEELVKEVSQRTEALVDSNKKLIDSNQELERFAYIASHDLKEPLRNISGFSRLISRELKDIENNKVKEYLGFVEENTFQMHTLIEDVLRYSQVKENNILEAVAINKVLDTIQLSLKHSIAERNAILFIDEIPTLKSNKTQLYQLFKNLIENAIKYNKSEIPRVEIKYWKEGQYHNISVSDNGIGIAPEYQGQVFKMFKRLHNRLEYQGSGLGLSIVKKIVKSLNGEISLESQEGKGSTFIVHLPIHTMNEFEVKEGVFSKEGVQNILG